MTRRWIILFCMVVVLRFLVSAQTTGYGKNYHWNMERGYEPFRHAHAEALIIGNTTMSPMTDSYKLPASASSFKLRFRAGNTHNHPAKSYTYADSDGGTRKIKNPAWGFFVKGAGGDSLIFTVRTHEEHDALSSQPVVRIVPRISGAEENVVIVKEGIDCHTGDNNWILSVEDGILNLSAGNREVKTVLSAPFSIGSVTEFGFIAHPGAEIAVSDITFSDISAERYINNTSWSNPDHLGNYLSASKDSLEGYWTVFDRTLEETLLQLGGDYRLAMVRDGDEYLLIYISGARVNASLWHPGAVKARLIPDPFPGTYSVVWYDSEGLPLWNAIKAQEGDGDTLVIQFPYHSSSLRLRKIPR